LPIRRGPPPSEAMQPPARFQSFLRVQTENGSAHKMNISAKLATLSRVHLRAARIILPWLRCSPFCNSRRSPSSRDPCRHLRRFFFFRFSPGMGSSDRPCRSKVAWLTASRYHQHPPAIPADQIIQKFSQQNPSSKRARQLHYTQTFVIQPSTRRQPRRRIPLDHRHQLHPKANATRRPYVLSLLTRITMSQQDLNDWKIFSLSPVDVARIRLAGHIRTLYSGKIVIALL